MRGLGDLQRHDRVALRKDEQDVKESQCSIRGCRYDDLLTTDKPGRISSTVDSFKHCIDLIIYLNLNLSHPS
jgi:hypothetical protein